MNNGAGYLPDMEWHSDSHTNSLMVVSAKGDAARLIHDYVDNTELAKVVFRPMGSE